MIKRFKIKNSPEVQEVIAFNDLKSLGKDGFLLVKLNSLNPDDANDLAEAIGLWDLGVPVVISTQEFSAYEVVDEIERTLEEDEKGNKNGNAD